MRLLIPVAVAAVSVSFMISQEGETPDQVVQGRYDAANGEFIEGVGACEISVTEVSCWDMHGARSKELEDQLQASLLSYGGNEIGFRFRMKNRVLAIRKSPGSSLSVMRVGGNYTQRQYPGPEGRAQFYSVALDPKDKTTSMLVSRHLPNAVKAFDVPFREGTQRVGAVDLIVGRSAPVDPRTMPGMMMPMPVDMSQFKVWSIPMQLPKVDASQRIAYAITPLDSDRRPILYVDKKGNPVSGVKMLESMDRQGTLASGFSPVSKDYAPVMFSAGFPVAGGAETYRSNINPAKIAFLRFSGSRNELIQINGFPLDPH
jgi:hypothetical protein